MQDSVGIFSLHTQITIKSQSIMKIVQLSDDELAALLYWYECARTADNGAFHTTPEDNILKEKLLTIFQQPKE